MRYRTIVADPPWDHSDGTGVNFADGGNVTGLPYSTLSLEEIGALPVRALAGRQAHLYLWTTNRFLEKSFGIVKAWGFAPAATLVWCKPPRGWNVGGTYASNVEFVIFATRNLGDEDRAALGEWLRRRRLDAGISAKELCARIGAHGQVNHGGSVSNWELGLNAPTIQQWQDLKRVLSFGDEMDKIVEEINADKGASIALQPHPTRWFSWPRADHSAKPDAFLDVVELVSPGPRIELFARRQRLGWDTWGNEALEHVELTA